ncbi:DNA/RNA nuclease SfsA [Govanella unica]|uniref:Sugar fermentation stimulation protein homolog n=1 Tax=Govanella unica TaxID=2975056 RepID=A0A9X3TXB1_9PROT|nr:DNA/RNA nuclease SfsA [Govania unica]MDA5193453.1 DNA/RNA nuclease SfsA [Govania unica]
MKFDHPLLPGRLVKRYKRFLADVSLPDGQIVTAHCMNSGSMLGLATPGSPVWLSPSTNPANKLKYKWELVEIDGALVGINTGHPNKLGAEAITEGLIPELGGYATIRREVKYGTNSRIDLLLEGHQNGLPPAHVEIKSVTLKRGPEAEFPDAVTERGTKHLREMAEIVKNGGRAIMFYIAQRADCTHFCLAEDIDPRYAQAFRAARDAGVEAIAYACDLSPTEIRVARPLALNID